MINLTYYEMVAEGDKTFVRQMIVTFLEDVPVMLATIKEKLDAQEWQELRKAVHKLKPAWSMSGLDVGLILNVEAELKGERNETIIITNALAIMEKGKDALSQMKQKLIEIDKELAGLKK